MSSAGVNEPPPQDEEDVSPTRIFAINREDDEGEEGEDEEDNHDDYIREFSFEPEIIVPKRTVSANSLTCYAATQATQDKARGPQRTQSTKGNPVINQPRVHFLRPNSSLSLSLKTKKRRHLRPPPGSAAAPSTELVSTIPPTADSGGGGQLVGSCSGPSTDSDQNRISLAEAVSAKQQHKLLRKKTPKRRVLLPEEYLPEFYPSIQVQQESERVFENGDFGEGDSDSSEGRRRKPRKPSKQSCWRRWCFEKGDRPSSAEQVHHEIEAFYYVGICG